MGTITVASTLEKVQIILQDQTGIRWPSETELLGWLNDGQREVLILKPNAYVVNGVRQLDAGTKQNLPANGIQLVDVVRNMGSAGITPGRSIRIASREILDAQAPDWHASTPSATVRHYIYSPLDPKHYYVYPPQPASGRGYVEEIYAAVPPNATANGTISLDDIYNNVLIDYVLYRAYSKDAEYAANAARASAHQAAYTGALTGKTNAEVIVNPNTNAPANPNV